MKIEAILNYLFKLNIVLDYLKIDIDIDIDIYIDIDIVKRSHINAKLLSLS
jgi:hypothetical protein